MRRILFIDDEAAILKALERTLRPLRHEWECRFADDPTDALRVVDEFQPDAVVSDMLMPGLDGAEFLTEAVALQPVMARLILSGEVGAGSLARMARVAHRCLAKPCRVEVLADVLRGVLPDTDESPAALQRGLYTLNALPVSPHAISALRRILSLPASDARDADAVRTIERAPGIAAKLLQVATWNSAGTGTRPTCVRDAFAQLGADAVQSLLDAGVIRGPRSDEATPFQPRGWTHCERAADLASAIARTAGCSSDDADRIVLVTAMGAATPLLLDALCAADYDAMRAEGAATPEPVHELEVRWFGQPGARFTARALRLWGLPPDVVGAVAKGDDLAHLSDDPLAPDVVSLVARRLVRETDSLAHDPVFAALAARFGRVAVDAWKAAASTLSH